MSTRPSPESLLDIEELRQLKCRYFRFVDEKRWQQVRALFTDDAAIEPVTGAPGDPDTFVASLEALAGEDVGTFHAAHMPEIELLSETEATARWALSFQVERREAGELRVLTGFRRYEDLYRKADGVWKIARMRISKVP